MEYRQNSILSRICRCGCYSKYLFQCIDCGWTWCHLCCRQELCGVPLKWIRLYKAWLSLRVHRLWVLDLSEVYHSSNWFTIIFSRGMVYVANIFPIDSVVQTTDQGRDRTMPVFGEQVHGNHDLQGTVRITLSEIFWILNGIWGKFPLHFLPKSIRTDENVTVWRPLPGVETKWEELIRIGRIVLENMPWLPGFPTVFRINYLIVHPTPSVTPTSIWCRIYIKTNFMIHFRRPAIYYYILLIRLQLTAL